MSMCVTESASWTDANSADDAPDEAIDDPCDLAAQSRALLAHESNGSDLDGGLRGAVEALLGGKWKLAILLRLGRDGEMKFGEILRSLPGVRTKALTSSLRALEEAQLVDREVILGVPTRVSYQLTKRAHLAIPLLLDLQRWQRSTSCARPKTERR